MRTKYFILATITLVIAINVVFGNKIRYDGYRVLRMTPHTKEHVKLLDKIIKLKGIQFWKGPSTKVGVPSDIMVPPQLIQKLKESGIENYEYISDVQKLIDVGAVNEKGTRINWNQYSRLDTIYDFLEEQVQTHSEEAKLITIGQTFEGRDLQLIKISKGEVSKPAIWIDSNIHAREWISGAVGTYFINELLNGEDPDIQLWKDDFDFYILPIANPDGFEYSHTVDRVWRKTRSTNTSTPCIGADPNRNFGYRWMHGGSSFYPCRSNYAGSSAFSEPETVAISNFYTSIASDVVAFITIHSYSQLILLPYGVKGELFPQYTEYMRITKKIEQGIAQRYGTVFKSGSITDILYPASGGSIDWVKAIHNTNLTLAFELRDTGRSGFLLPSNQIIPSSLEFIDGFQVIIDQLRIGISTPETKSKKTLLQVKMPMTPLTIDHQTFGDVPSRSSPITSGFLRH